MPSTKLGNICSRQNKQQDRGGRCLELNSIVLLFWNGWSIQLINVDLTKNSFWKIKNNGQKLK